MKISNTKRIAQKIMNTMEIRQASSMVNSIITNHIKDYSLIPYDVNALRKEAMELKNFMINNGGKILSTEQIMLLLMIESLLEPYFTGQPEILNFFMNLILEECKVFDVKEFSENPYVKNIKFKNERKGDYELKYNSFMPYEIAFHNVPKRIEKLHIDIPRLSCFSKQFDYPAIYQSSIESTWMSVSPNEVFTMENAVKNAKGKVLTLGCGMGYFAYIASLKEEVESVTIIEIEQSVIDLFEKFILPQFENSKKIKVIRADAIEYMNNLKDGIFDYCFADIWLGAEDIIPYFLIKETGRKFKRMKIDYWIEETFAILLSDYVWIEILNVFSKVNHIEIPNNDYQFTDDYLRKEKFIHKLLKNEQITKPEDIDMYMNPKKIIDLINKTKIIF